MQDKEQANGRQSMVMIKSWMTERDIPQTEEPEDEQQEHVQIEEREPGMLVAGLDIGSTKICAMVGEVFPDRVEIIGVGTAPSSGMRKGVVVNIQSTVDSIRSAVKEASDMAGCDINQVYVGVAGSHVKAFNSPGIIGINNKEITPKEVKEVIEAAQTVKISDNQSIIHVLAQEYMVDDHTGIQSPLGMTGVRLATNVHIVTADITALHNLTACCSQAGLTTAKVVLESVAAAETVLTRTEKDQGVGLIDIGGGTTDLAIFSQGTSKHSWELPRGGNTLTSDLSVGLRTPLQEAEELKYLYGGALASMIKENQMIEVPSVGDRKSRKVSQKILVGILEARMEEIFQLIDKNISSSGSRNRINAGLVLTGGTALLPNIVELAEQVFDVPVRIGYPRNVGGQLEKINTPRSTTAVGLVLFGANERGAVEQEQDGIVKKLKRLFKGII